MARIRTVKPELWSDPDFVERSSNARLLFVAGLNFASDYGVLPDKPLQLKMQCFPGDNLDIEPLIDELLAARLWVRRVAPDGASVLVIRTFCNHQKVDKPNAGRWGDPRKWDDSPTAPGPLPDDSTNDRRTFTPGREGKGREGKGNSSSSSSVTYTGATSNPTKEDEYPYGEDQEPRTATPVPGPSDLANAILHELGYAQPPAIPGEVRSVEHALGKGWLPDQLIQWAKRRAAQADYNPRTYAFQGMGNIGSSPYVERDILAELEAIEKAELEAIEKGKR